MQENAIGFKDFFIDAYLNNAIPRTDTYIV
jgi:hypothetical protein